jgi:DNA-binding MarR family transcriptional regulator
VMAAITSVSRVHRLLSAMVDTTLRPLDLTFARFEALGLLYFSPTGGMPLGKMSERLQVHPATVTSVVDRLEKQGLVRRVRPDGDRRVVLAEILPAGRAVMEKATDVVVNEVFPKLPWSKSEQRAVIKLLAQVRRLTGDFD